MNASQNPARPSALVHHAEWDAGYMGCGEVIILLRQKMQPLNPGEILKLTSQDLGAPEDLPAWCRMTGRRLIQAHHPHYWIQQKETSQ